MKSMCLWLTRAWNVHCLFPSGLQFSVCYLHESFNFFPRTTPEGEPSFTIQEHRVDPSSPSRHNHLKHTTWSSLFNCLISLHSTTDRLFIFIFSMNKSFNYHFFFSSINGNTVFLPNSKKKIARCSQCQKSPNALCFLSSCKVTGTWQFPFSSHPSHIPVKFTSQNSTIVLRSGLDHLSCN